MASAAMAPVPERKIRSWFQDNIGTLITIAVLAGGMVANFATTQYRVEAIEQRVDRIESKVVPREVTDVKDQALERRLEAIEKQANEMNQKLDRVLLNQGPRR